MILNYMFSSRGKDISNISTFLLADEHIYNIFRRLIN